MALHGWAWEQSHQVSCCKNTKLAEKVLLAASNVVCAFINGVQVEGSLVQS